MLLLWRPGARIYSQEIAGTWCGVVDDDMVPPTEPIPWFKVLKQFHNLKPKVFTGDNDRLSTQFEKNDKKHNVMQMDAT